MCIRYTCYFFNYAEEQKDDILKVYCFRLGLQISVFTQNQGIIKFSNFTWQETKRLQFFRSDTWIKLLSDI